MRNQIHLEIHPQPDDETCGPTCLHALYRYYGDDIPLGKVVREISRTQYGGTLIEILACHALKRGYDATIYTYHVQMFDPTWFAEDGELHDPVGVRELLAAQLKYKKHLPRMTIATRAYREFLELGGQLRMEDLSPDLIAHHISRRTPIVTGLSSTFLYREQRMDSNSVDDDVQGSPQGHFVMLVGYDGAKAEVMVADPLDENPPFHTNNYRLPVARLINSILLGILTHDANLLVISPSKKRTKRPAAKPAVRKRAGALPKKTSTPKKKR